MPNIQNLALIALLGLTLSLPAAAVDQNICLQALGVPGPHLPPPNDQFDWSYVAPPPPPTGRSQISGSSPANARAGAGQPGGGTPHGSGIMGHVAGSYPAPFGHSSPVLTGPPAQTALSRYNNKYVHEGLPPPSGTLHSRTAVHPVVDLSVEDVADLLTRSGVALPGGHLEMSDRGRAEARGFARIFRDQDDSIYGRRAKFQITHDSGHNSWILATVVNLIPANDERPRTQVRVAIDERSELTGPSESRPLWEQIIPAHHFTAIKGVAAGVAEARSRDLVNVVIRDRDTNRINLSTAPALLGKRIFVSGTLVDGVETAMSAVLVGIWYDGEGYRLLFSEAGQIFEFRDAALTATGPEYDL